MPNIIGILEVRVGGQVQRAKGNFTFNLGADKLDAVIGADGVHGAMAKPQVAFIEGEFTDAVDFSVSDLVNIREEDVILSTLNGKKYVWPSAWYAGDGNVQTEEGNITVRFESQLPAEEIL